MDTCLIEFRQADVDQTAFLDFVENTVFHLPVESDAAQTATLKAVFLFHIIRAMKNNGTGAAICAWGRQPIPTGWSV